VQQEDLRASIYCFIFVRHNLLFLCPLKKILFRFLGKENLATLWKHYLRAKWLQNGA
jgi:hypothetical protein